MKLTKNAALFKVCLAVIVACFGLSAIYSTALVMERERAIAEMGRYNLHWMIGQGLAEIIRLERSIAAFGMNSGEVEASEVRTAFEIVVGRLRILNGALAGPFFESNSRHRQTLADLTSALDTIGPMLDQIEAAGSPARLLEILAPISRKMARLSSDANSWSSDRLYEEQRQLIGVHWLFVMAASGLILCGIGLIILLVVRNKVLQSTQRKLHQTSSALELNNLALRNQEADLQRQYQRFDAALNHMSQGLCLVGPDLGLIVCNQRFRELFGLGNARLENTPLGKLIADPLLPKADHFSQIEWTEQPESDAVGIKRIILASHQPLPEGGWVSTFEDVTDERLARERISHMAHHDALTGQPNRLFFWRRAASELQIARAQGTGLSVFFLDLDSFKEINDTAGHPTGDALLCAVSERLVATVGERDFVARLGGDEFAVLHPNEGEPEADTRTFAERLVQAINQPYSLGERTVTVGASIGIANAPQDGSTTEELMQHADLALYRAKENGSNPVQFFDPDMKRKLQSRVSIEADLRLALERGQFDLHYQPLVCLASGRIVGCEALLRWLHPQRGWVSPMEFIPIAESTGLITPIGEWALRRACKDAVRWPDEIRVAVNLSPVQFRGGRLLETIDRALDDSSLPAKRLELEITESLFLHHNGTNLDLLRDLRARGISIALDDFGTGYSSLGYLRSFPFDKIKIDQTFVREIEPGSENVAIITSVTSLAQGLKMAAVAEGVETVDQLHLVRDAGCTQAQGYYFSRPLPEQDFRALVQAAPAYLASAFQSPAANQHNVLARATR